MSLVLLLGRVGFFQHGSTIHFLEISLCYVYVSNEFLLFCNFCCIFESPQLNCLFPYFKILLAIFLNISVSVDPNAALAHSDSPSFLEKTASCSCFLGAPPPLTLLRMGIIFRIVLLVLSFFLPSFLCFDLIFIL